MKVQKRERKIFSEVKAVTLGTKFVVKNLIPNNDNYPTIIIDTWGASLSTGTLAYWAKQEGAEVVYEEDTVEVTF